MKYFFLIPLMIGISNHTFSQTVTGTVTDSKTREPLPYVHIGVLNRNLGVISRDDGNFEITLSNVRPDEELIFSTIGYELKKIKIGDLKEQSLAIKLIPKVYQLKEVVVRAGKVKEPTKLGRYKITPITTGHGGTQAFGFGGEWGLRVFLDGKKYRIQDARFHLRFNTLDSVLFRVQIYSIKDDLPGESLLKKEAFVKSRNKDHLIICNLEQQDIVLDQDVFVTFEVVRLWFRNKRDNQLFFTHGAGYEEGLRISRASSHDQWKQDESPPIVLYLSGEEVK